MATLVCSVCSAAITASTTCCVVAPPAHAGDRRCLAGLEHADGIHRHLPEHGAEIAATAAPCVGVAPVIGACIGPVTPGVPTLGVIVGAADPVQHYWLLEQIDGHRDQRARLLHHLEVGLIRAVGFAHVRELDQHVDVGQLDVAVGIRRRMVRIVLDAERRAIEIDAIDLDERAPLASGRARSRS